jgi:hypothetical protein
MTTPQRFSLAALGAVGLLLLIIFAADLVDRRRAPSAPRTFEIEMRADAGTNAQLFWADDLGFDEQRSSKVALQHEAAGFQRLRFPLPPAGIRWLRFDPTDAPGDIVVARARLLGANDTVLQTFEPASFRPLHDIASIEPHDGGVKITPIAGATDPFLILSLGHVDRPTLWKSLRLVTPIALVASSLVAAALVAAAVVLMLMAAFDRRSPTPATDRAWRLSALWVIVLCLIVFSSKLLLMRQNPVTTPFWDQWDAEAAALFIPYQQWSLPWQTMFGLHNEHRVLFSRLIALDLLALNGEWDPRLEQVANACMHTVTAAIVVLMVWIAAGRRRLDLIVLVCALTFAAPFAWENTLIGFQSAFYFLLLFSVLALALITTFRPGTAGWRLGWLCAFLGLFTAAGGLLTPVAIAVVVGLRIVDDPSQWRAARADLIGIGIVLTAGVLTMSPPLEYHAYLKAKSVSDVAVTLGHNLAWPWIGRPAVSLIMWLPAALLMAGALLRRGRTTAFERLALGLGAWVALQAAALAYGRGGGGALPATRYLDFLSLGFVANTMAMLALFDRARERGFAKPVAIAVVAVWFTAGIAGIDHLTSQSLLNLELWRSYFAAHTTTVRRFVATNDVDDLKARRPLAEVPYPNHERLIGLLQDPDVRRILPASVREPIPVWPKPSADHAFVREGGDRRIPSDPVARGWWSLSDDGRRAQGRFESAPTGPCRAGGRMAFQIAGYLGWEGQRLAVKDLQTGSERAIVLPEVAKERWVETRVPCPDGPFSIVAVDASPDSWFGFREPVEVGWLSPIVESLIASSRVLLIVALALAVVLLRLA